MQRFKIHILAALGLLIVAGAITAVSQKRVLAALGYTPVRDITNPALQPFAHTFDISFTQGSFGSEDIIVPAGKRLVIETVSCSAFLASGDSVDFSLDAFTNGSAMRYNFPSTRTGFFFVLERHRGLHPVRIYADPGSIVRGIVQKNNITTVGTGSIVISGYLVALP